MEYRIIDLYDYFGRAREGAKKGYLAAYVHDDLTELPNRRVRPIMLVIPGGGYTNVSQREAEPIAIQYFAQGFDCFVLDYDVAPLGYPFQIMEAGMAMLYLRREGEAACAGAAPHCRGRIFGGRASCGVRELSLG